MLRSAKLSPTDADSGGTLHAESHSGPECDSAWSVPPESVSVGDSFADLNVDFHFTMIIRVFLRPTLQTVPCFDHEGVKGC